MNNPSLVVKTLGSALIALTISVSSVLAQAPAKKPTPKPLPPGPLPAAAPDFAQWQITEKYDTLVVTADGSNASAGGQGATMPGGEQSATTPGGEQAKTNVPPPSLSDSTTVVIKTKPLYHEEQVGAKNEQRWYTENASITVPSGQAPILFLKARGTGAKADFSDLGWISPSNYVDTISYMGRDCYLFKSSMEGNEVKVCLDAKTRLPLIYQTSNIDTGMSYQRVYTWGSAPPSKIILPPNVQLLVDSSNRAIKKTNQLPARP